MTTLRLRVVAALGLALSAACSAGAPGGGATQTDAFATAAPLDGAVDFADYMVPDCEASSTPQYIEPQVFRTVPLGGNRFAVVKSLDAAGFEDWTVDDDWLRLGADNTWAYQANGQWCDTECGAGNDGDPCHHRWRGDPADYANTLYRDPDDGSLAAPFLRRRMNFEGGVFRFTAHMRITGQRRNGCGECGTNFDSPRVPRTVTARRYAARSYPTPCGNGPRTFDDVVELHVDRGPGEGETSVYARGQGFIGFGGRGEPVRASCWPDPSLPTTGPHDVCGGGGVGSICAALGRGDCRCMAGAREENACYYDEADRVACGLPGGAGCATQADWQAGWLKYHEVCGG